MEIDQPLLSLPVDVLTDSGITDLVIHVSTSSSSFLSTNPLPLSSLRLNSGDQLFGIPVSPPNEAVTDSLPWIINLSNMTDLSLRILDQVQQLEGQEVRLKNSATCKPHILAVSTSTTAKPSPSGKSVMKALFSKYVVSQEIEETQNSQDGSLSSSASSWHSSASSVPKEAIQVIGAMGGKSIEFHKPKLRSQHEEDPLLSSGSPFLTYPNVSLHNLQITSFSGSDFGVIPLEGLQSLDLSQNALSSWRHHVAPLLASAPTLKTLNLSSNALDAIYPSEASNTSKTTQLAQTALSWLSTQSSLGSTPLHIFVDLSLDESSQADGETSLPRTEIEIPSSFLQDRELFVPSPSLSVLVLNKTGITWKSFVLIASSLPHLTEAHLCFNRLQSLEPAEIRVQGANVLGSQSLQLLNLDSNAISDFSNLARAISHFPSLSKLILSNNPIASIDADLQLPPTHPFHRQDPANPWIMNLSSTGMTSWSSLQALTKLVPSLGDIRWQRNKMRGFGSTGSISDQLSRHYVVAICPSVTMVNGSGVGEQERRDSERLYLVHFFSALPVDQSPSSEAALNEFLERTAQTDPTVKHLWNTLPEVTREAFQRTRPSASGAAGSSSPSGISMLDVSIADETGSFFVTKKLPASTSIAQLRTIVTAAVNQAGLASQYGNFALFLMEPSSMGPPSFQPLTYEQSTLAHETARIKITIILRPCK